MKKIPYRMCVVTKEKYPKRELLRIVVSDGTPIIDDTGKVNGHGCYLKKDVDVVKIAKDKKILNRVLGVEISNEFYDSIIDKIK